MNSKKNIYEFLSYLKQDKGVYHNKGDISIAPFEQAYINARKTEGRVLSDEEVKILPNIKNRPHKGEWKLRQKSATRILQYFSQTKESIVLDIGCGNGWLTSGIAQNPSLTVLGIDMNLTELYQASRVFQQENLFFVYGDIFDLPLKKSTIQVITLVAAVQYFKDLNKLIRRLMELLSYNGEIHIIDSPIYSASEIAEAKTRSHSYYKQAGQEEMINYYFHHDFDDLIKWEYEILYKQSKRNYIRKFLGTNDMPFPWIKITKKK